MFKKLTAISLLALAGSAYAVDGTVTVSGGVSTATCTVTPSSSAVTLPTVSKTSLASAGQTAGTTPWSVAVSACSATTMNTFFEPGNSVNANGRLNTSITNVDLQMLSSTYSVITMGAAAGSQGTTAVTVASNAATQQFYLRYYATGAAGTGTFTNTTTFTFTLLYT